jgi:hypothetical protein
MIKFNVIYYYAAFALGSICNSCAQEVNPNRAYFTINPMDRKILVPVQLDDSTRGNLVFDTWGSLILDSAFCAENPSISFYNTKKPAKEFQSGAFWSNQGMRTVEHETPQAITIGNSLVEYNRVMVYDLKRYMGNNELDGVFNIPQNDSTNVWELNFEHNYIEVHQNKSFKMPENCFIFPMVNQTGGDNYGERNSIKIQLPIQIKFPDGDTLSMNRIYYIDTGMPWDIVLMRNAAEHIYLSKRNDAVWTEDQNYYYRHFNVKGALFDNLVMDSLRIYTFDRHTALDNFYIIGINFLKRFNVFFDMKNKQVGLQPIINYHRIIDPLARRYHYSTMKTKEGKILVTKVADYKSNYYKTAGLREGDEIISVNGKPYKDITRKEKREFYTKDSLIFEIVRNKQALKIVVPVDKNELQGE